MSKYHCLSGSALKLIATVTMLFDHIAAAFIPDTSFAYIAIRFIGRLAFPIYVFLLTEGAAKTSDRKQYGLNLLLFALLSEIPWNLLHGGTIFYPTQNVYFTLLFGYIGILAWDKYPGIKRWVILILLFITSVIFKADYSWFGFVIIVTVYALREHKAIQYSVFGSALFLHSYPATLALFPVSMYNGERGFIKGKTKYFFYAFYPAHLLILACIKLIAI